MLASTLQTSLLIGLEGRGLSKEGTYASYNSCFFVSPDKPWPERYDKQLLLPLGEYIPFESLRSFLSAYGIHDSFSPGTGAALFVRGPLRIAPLICYEETFSSYAREAWLLHPNLLVSLSNDCWYPSIRHEHLELARLRAVEVGIPLLRSCNQGVSAAIDALGRTIASRGDSKEAENSCVITPLSTYTAYSLFATLGSNVIASWLFLLWSVTFLYSRLSPESQEIEQPTLG